LKITIKKNVKLELTQPSIGLETVQPSMGGSWVDTETSLIINQSTLPFFLLDRDLLPDKASGVSSVLRPCLCHRGSAGWKSLISSVVICQDRQGQRSTEGSRRVPRVRFASVQSLLNRLSWREPLLLHSLIAIAMVSA
jgi:hypothetical protein